LESYPKLLLFGEFTWDGISRALLHLLVERSHELEDRGVRLAVFNLGSPDQVDAMCPYLREELMTATAAPVFAYFVNARLAKTHWGMMSFSDVLTWLFDDRGRRK
jgi:hypothetical protein